MLVPYIDARGDRVEQDLRIPVKRNQPRAIAIGPDLWDRSHGLAIKEVNHD